ncbi:hypothetical protein, partial [Pseudogemmobacter humi]|uniref:hypothetical protein n=1 Tax=Pseudogemmobacter humi TaxID=2483812 RepID=UPI001F3120D5
GQGRARDQAAAPLPGAGGEKSPGLPLAAQRGAQAGRPKNLDAPNTIGGNLSCQQIPQPQGHIHPSRATGILPFSLR